VTPLGGLPVDTTTGFCVSAVCVVTDLSVTYWGGGCGWFVVELMFLPIVARATHVQSKRMHLLYLCLQSCCVVKHTHTHTHTHSLTNTHTHTHTHTHTEQTWCFRTKTLEHCRLTFVFCRNWLLQIVQFGICTRSQRFSFCCKHLWNCRYVRFCSTVWKCAWIWAIFCIVYISFFGFLK